MGSTMAGSNSKPAMMVPGRQKHLWQKRWDTWSSCSLLLRNSTVVKMFLKLKRSWGAIRWKMMTIFVFFSVVSMILVGCFAVAVLNVVIRRESAYLVEERIKLVVSER